MVILTQMFSPHRFLNTPSVFLKSCKKYIKSIRPYTYAFNEGIRNSYEYNHENRSRCLAVIMKETNIKTKFRTIDLRERFRYHTVYFVITLNGLKQQFRNLNCVKK